MARTRFRLTLTIPASGNTEGDEVFSDVIWAQEQMQSNAPGGVVLVYEPAENPTVTALYKEHGMLKASWEPI